MYSALVMYRALFFLQTFLNILRLFAKIIHMDEIHDRLVSLADKIRQMADRL